MDVRRIRAEEWLAFKNLRLEALLDSPSAFGATYDEQSREEDDYWRRRAEQGASSNSAALFVADSGTLGAMAWGVVDQEHPRLGHLYGMYVAPALRDRGIGRSLVEAVCQWARSVGVDRVLLDVTEMNAPAIALYERCGFVRTGRTQPLPHTPTITEIEMERAL